MYKWLFFLDHWKLGVHLIFKTRHFGANNQWWVKQPSVIGLDFWEFLAQFLMVVPLIRNYQALMIRACIGWMPKSDCEKLGKL